jgi:hypothetical protein
MSSGVAAPEGRPPGSAGFDEAGPKLVVGLLQRPAISWAERNRLAVGGGVSLSQVSGFKRPSVRIDRMVWQHGLGQR